MHSQSTYFLLANTILKEYLDEIRWLKIQAKGTILIEK